MKYEVLQADPADGDKLLELIESQAAKGDLEILYTRRPNPVISYQNESKSTSIGVIKDETGTPCFMEVCIVRDYYLHEQKATLMYACGVRKKTGCGNNFSWLRDAYQYETKDKTAGFCSILDANLTALDVFGRKPRKFFPTLAKLCEYTTFLINPRAVKRCPRNRFTFRRVEESDLPQVYHFLENEGKKYEMYPVVCDLENQFSGLLLKDCYILTKEGEIAAFGALWNQRHYRQFIVKHYGGIYRYLRKAAGITEKLGYIYLPPEGQTAQVLTLTLMTCKDGDAGTYSVLLSNLAKQAIQAGCPILAAGMSKNNHYYQAYRKLRSIRFDSTIFTVDVQGNQLPLPDAAREIHIECGYL